MGCDLYVNVDNHDDILLIEKWQSSVYLERHIRSEHFFLILSAMELGCKGPLVEFHKVHTTSGIEYIESIRGNG